MKELVRKDRPAVVILWLLLCVCPWHACVQLCLAPLHTQFPAAGCLSATHKPEYAELRADNSTTQLPLVKCNCMATCDSVEWTRVHS